MEEKNFEDIEDENLHSKNIQNETVGTFDIPLSHLFFNFLILFLIGLVMILIWQGDKSLIYFGELFAVTNITQNLFISFIGTVILLSYVVITSRLGLLKFPDTEYTEIMLTLIKKPFGPATIAIGAGISEEILFRAALLGIFAAWLGGIWGVLLSSLIFLAMHIPQYAGHLHSHIVVFVMGMFLGWLFVWTGTLWGPILAHALYNYMNAVFIRNGWLEV